MWHLHVSYRIRLKLLRAQNNKHTPVNMKLEIWYSIVKRYIKCRYIIMMISEREKEWMSENLTEKLYDS